MKCHNCDGTGKVRKEIWVCNIYGEPTEEEIDCDDCAGTGFTERDENRPNGQ